MLETEIKKLSAQIEQLNSNFEKFFNSATSQPEAQPEAQPEQQPEAQPEQQPEQQPETQPEQQPETSVTGDDVRQLCLEKSRENKENKAKIKAVLSDLGAKLVSDLNDEGLTVARNKIGAL